ncbi:hypothetical protein L5515_003442 [Caenorhabditis briggsae]|uniref:Uncharacterized protein n=1 Tax=Caenorhabditis briggsae TaxID=6238 RepID=A0AAE9EKL4_CAEBR|nr:hypothetical protein L5515_003442 [Caenorhabditis briggsae]
MRRWEETETAEGPSKGERRSAWACNAQLLDSKEKAETAKKRKSPPHYSKKFYQRHLKRKVLEQRRIRNEEPLWDVFIHHNYDGQEADGEQPAQAISVTEPEAKLENVENGRASNTTLAAKDTNVEMAEIHAERHNSPMLESVWSEKLERSDSSNTDESPMKPTNADAVTANHIGAQFPAEWKTRREIKDEAVFRFLNWAKKLGDEDKDKKAEEKEKELAEIAETRFLENKQKFRSLLIEREFSAEEWTLMKQFLDYPELAAIVVKMRRSQGVPGLRQNRRRCLTCEESLAGMPLTAHKTEHCSIPYESRILVSKRLFGQRKCYGCGRMKEDGNCNCKSVPCRRCWRWNVPESFPHLQVMGTCQMVWKIRQETGHVPTEHEISDFTKRNDKIASIIQHKLEKFVAETERELVDAGRASNQKTEA